MKSDSLLLGTFRRVKPAVLHGVIALALASVAAAGEPVKNIIYLIGDGMGLAHVAAAATVSKTPLSLERCTAIGLSKTHSASAWVTDSAAGGTALSSGYKTTNGFIGMHPDKTPGKTLLEYARDSGKAIGAVVTCSITHATPGAFLAHRESRGSQEEIAEDIVASGVDVFIGGGRKFFEERKDGKNLSEALRAKNYKVVYTIDDALQTTSGKLGALLAPDALPKSIEDRGDVAEKSLAAALNLLTQNQKGFVLMVEGSQIDWGAHKNHAEWTISEVIDFDKVVRKAMDFADANPGTLVVVTADHETGGMTLHGGNFEKGTVEAKFASGGHTGIMVPVYAYGAGSEKFSGIYENTEIFHKMMGLLQLKQDASGRP